MKRVLICGADGYMGHPITLKCLERGYQVFGIDNGLRRVMVSEVGGESGIPIPDMNTRIEFIKGQYPGRYEFFNRDLMHSANIGHILSSIKPDVILHLASQPSAPYSHRSLEKAIFTQTNNITMLLNLMFHLHNLKMDHTHLVVTTTTGIYGQPDYDIPEGWIYPNEMKVPHPNMAGSFYHMSRGFDSGNMYLASKHFNFPITELRTSIVGGSSTEETRKYPLFANRFDFDFDFGVVTNRFVAQALMNKPITIYGTGEQRRPIISLEDVCESTVNCVTLRVDQEDLEHYMIYNQTQDTISPVEIAAQVKKTLEREFATPVNIMHIDNPRVENEVADMKMDNSRFISDLVPNGFKVGLNETITQICRDVQPYKFEINKIGQNYK